MCQLLSRSEQAKTSKFLTHAHTVNICMDTRFWMDEHPPTCLYNTRALFTCWRKLMLFIIQEALVDNGAIVPVHWSLKSLCSRHTNHPALVVKVVKGQRGQVLIYFHEKGWSKFPSLILIVSFSVGLVIQPRSPNYFFLSGHLLFLDEQEHSTSLISPSMFTWHQEKTNDCVLLNKNLTSKMHALCM